MKSLPSLRLPALALTLALLLSPAARALTVDQAGELLEDYYIDEVPDRVLEQETIPAMLDALGDPYTQYFTAEEYAQFNSTMADSHLVGIGILSRAGAQGLEVLRVYEDSPARDAGLRPGDLIVAVDGRDAAGQDAATVSGWLQGEPGAAVSVSFLRDGAERTVTLLRREITVPTVYAELWEGHIGYLDCDSFGDETPGHFLDALETYGETADRWIVDLRGNGGGLVDAAADAAACFTGQAVGGYLRDRAGNLYPCVSELDSQTPYPVIVLTDADTASASELFAADIRDGGAGLVIGCRTYGKGVAQSLIDQRTLPDYFPEGDAIKITSVRSYSSGGVTADTVGVIPHLLVDADLAPGVAVLLSASAPDGDTAGYLRVDLGRQWYVDLDQTLGEGLRAAFSALLEALPPAARVLEGTGSGWADAQAADLAEAYGLTDYSPRAFDDIAGSPYADQIARLAAYGLVRGDGSGAFRPEEGLTRAQLCALLAQALNCTLTEGDGLFSDVPADAWYAPHVSAAARLGLVEGVGDGRFDPEGMVTCQQLITVLGRLGLRLSLSLDLDAWEAPADVLEDPALAGYAGWARPAVWLLSQSQRGLLGNPINLLWAPPEDIDPDAPASREEAAFLLCSLLNYIGILPS